MFFEVKGRYFQIFNKNSLLRWRSLLFLDIKFCAAHSRPNLLIFGNLSPQNVHDRQQCIKFRKSLKRFKLLHTTEQCDQYCIPALFTCTVLYSGPACSGTYTLYVYMYHTILYSIYLTYTVQCSVHGPACCGVLCTIYITCTVAMLVVVLALLPKKRWPAKKKTLYEGRITNNCKGRSSVTRFFSVNQPIQSNIQLSVLLEI